MAVKKKKVIVKRKGDTTKTKTTVKKTSAKKKPAKKKPNPQASRHKPFYN